VRESVNNLFCRAVIQTMFLLLCFLIQTASAQTTTSETQPSPTPPKSSSEQSDDSKQDQRDPVERSDEFKSKLTFGIYFTPGARVYDLNLRHQFGPFTAWIAGFYDPKSNKLMRIGAQYDYKKGWLHLVPTLEIATTRAMSGSLYSELGAGKTYAIAGIARTNLRPFFDLFWDPGDSIQLGMGHKISSYDRIQGYTIFDVRLHTGQQNTHILWRHKLNANNGITFDAVFKTGHGDSGEFIRAVGIGVYYDREKWFWKLYYDPHVNFADHTMVRSGIGLKF
jgi:hypothetical protein